MIVVEYNVYGSESNVSHETFSGDNCFDDFLYWFFKNDVRDYKFIKGKKIHIRRNKTKGDK